MDRVSREDIQERLRRRIRENVWGKTLTSKLSFWGKRRRRRFRGLPGWRRSMKSSQVMPQLIGVIDFTIDTSGTWLVTDHIGTDQIVFTRIPRHVQRITVDREDPVA